MGIVADISDLVIQVYKLWRDARDGTTIAPQELYEKYVRPAYVLIKEVHADYTDLYLELSERLRIAGQIDDQLIAWFARAGTRRWSDRSELAVLDLPAIQAGDETAQLINDEALGFIAAIQTYFIPAQTPQRLSEKRVGHYLGDTAATATEKELRFLAVWAKLSIQDRLALEAEKESEHRTSHTHVGYPDDEIIHFVMTAVIGETDSSLIKRIRATEWKSSDANSKGNRSGCSDATEVALQLPHGLASRRPRRSDLPTGIDQAPRDWSADVRTLEKFSWSNIIHDHIERQRKALELGMKDIQRHWVRLRILADRE